tara:strand:- start:3055 stop:5940 length:2886 start_codon:yes stop_codon:yes gene_type:complete
MATFLSKLFKPKWQSKHLETRKQTLSELDGFNTEDLKILIHLVEADPSSDIQHLAIQKIADTEALTSLHKKAKDKLKTALENRLYDIATAQSLSIFDLIIDLDLLTDMIIKSNHADTYIRGLARIQDTLVLFKIATQSRNAQIRQAAAELIETEKELSELFTHAKGKDKTVYQITKAKLAEIRSQAQHQTEQQALIEKLLKDLDNLNKTEALQHFDARLSHLVKQWESLSSLTDDVQKKSFSELYSQCQQKLASIENAIALTKINNEEHTEPPQQAEETNEIAETITTIQDTLRRFQSQAAKTLEISALDALIKTQENRWLEATRDSDVTKAQQISYQDGMTQLRHYLKAMHTFADQNEQLSANIAELNKLDSSPNELEQQRKKLKYTLNTIDWPSQFKLPEQIIDANKALEISKERKDALAEKQKIIEQQINKQIEGIDLALEDKQIKDAIKQFKDLQSNLNKLETRRSEKFQAGITLRKNQLNELKDWQGFVSTPKQEELCVAMERLANTHIDPTEKADKIKTMQQAWRSLGGTGDQALWMRFKTAADRAFEPCSLFFAEQKQLKQANLNKRKTLLNQLNDYVNSIEWDKVSSQHTPPVWQTSDWKTAEKINRQARQEWRDAFPIDFKANRPIQSEFNKLMDTFDQHLEDERSYNLDLKETIVEEANALTEAEDVEATIQAVKSLQEKWQNIGITHHKADRKLWSNYRAACDAIFAKRNLVREEKRSELDEAIKEAHTIASSIEKSSASLESKSYDELKALLSANRKQAESMPVIPAKVRDKLSQRIDLITHAIKDEIKQREKYAKLAEWVEVSRKATILREVYNDPSAIQEVSTEAFSSKVPLGAKIEKQLEEAWNHICKGNTESLGQIDDIQAKELCIASEIASGIESPSEDKALRMQLQVSRLSEGLSSSSEHISREAQLENALAKWYLSFGLSSITLADLEPRIEAARDALLTPK